MKSAKEFFKERFGVDVTSDNERFMIVMMREYAEYYHQEKQKPSISYKHKTK